MRRTDALLIKTKEEDKSRKHESTCFVLQCCRAREGGDCCKGNSRLITRVCCREGNFGHSQNSSCVKARVLQVLGNGKTTNERQARRTNRATCAERPATHFVSPGSVGTSQT